MRGRNPVVFMSVRTPSFLKAHDKAGSCLDYGGIEQRPEKSPEANQRDQVQQHDAAPPLGAQRAAGKKNNSEIMCSLLSQSSNRSFTKVLQSLILAKLCANPSGPSDQGWHLPSGGEIPSLCLSC